MRVGLSDLKAHKYAHNFLDTSDGNCSCATGIENNIHFLLKCTNFDNQRKNLLETVYPILSSLYDLEQLKESNLASILLYGDNKLTLTQNRKILNATINFILSSKRFIADKNQEE